MSGTTSKNVDGWTIDVNYGSVSGLWYGKCRGDKSWYGFNWGLSVGSIKTTLHGCGKAELDFGECWDSQNWNSRYTQINLNGNEIGRAKARELRKKIQFDFKEGDVLELHDRGYAMIIFNNFTILSCC